LRVFQLILLLMKLFVICGFIRNIRAVNASLLFMTILVVYEHLVGLEWARKCWSVKGMCEGL
jgi:hypothetical protein